MTDTEVKILSPDSQKDFVSGWYELAQDSHFWMRGRLSALLKQFKNNKIPVDRTLKGLEIGCGHGVLRWQIEQKTRWTIDGVDLDLQSLKNNPPCRGKAYLYNIFDRNASLKEHYDFIILFDVIEHIADVKSFLEASAFHLKAGGWVFINVPALQEIYSNYDTFVGHLRRYDKNMMAKTFDEAGLKSVCINFWGMSFLPLLWARKALLARNHQEESIVQKGFSPPGRAVNALLRAVISAEVSLFPFPSKGTSIMAIAQKPNP
jgi:hypothetical protein